MWYSKVVADLSNIPDFIADYERELESAKSECRIDRKSTRLNSSH